jgi:predicted component of type VI protein secretion system
MALGVGAVAQSPQPQKNQGGCYDTDANGKEVFVPNCGLPSVPTKQPAPATSAPTDTSGSSTMPAAPSDPARQFPFPGETSPAQAPAVQQPGTAPAAAPATRADPAKAFPFPGEENTPLVRPDGQVVPPPEAGQSPDGLKDAGSSGDSSGSDSSSSSSSSSSSPLSGLPDDPATKGPLADDPDAVIKKPHRKLPAVAAQTPSEREEEDLSVADFYMNDNNFRGAYTRAADAVVQASDDPNAHFALAEAARKLGKLDEAMAEYKKTLTLDPVPKQKKAAEKALKEMAGG